MTIFFLIFVIARVSFFLFVSFPYIFFFFFFSKMIWSYLFYANDTEERKLLLPRYYRNQNEHSNDSDNDDQVHNFEEQQRSINTGQKESRSSSGTRKMTFLFTFSLLATFYVTAVFTRSLFNSFSFKDINTIISFGDSYTTRYLDMETLTYACRNCTSAGGPNWVVYLTDNTDWISWDFAYNSAPVNNSIVNQVEHLLILS